MYRFARKLRENRPALDACLDACAASLRAEYPDIGRDVAIDASDMPAFANGQRYVSQNGPERERFSDPDASWGHRSNQHSQGWRLLRLQDPGRCLHAHRPAARVACRDGPPS